MRIRIDTGGEVPELSIDGRFDAHETATFRGVVDSLLLTSTSGLAVNLANVVFVDSSALAELLRTQKEVRKLGAELTLVDPSDPVRIILEVTALQQVFTIKGTDLTVDAE